jgi:hypothetical protein
MTNQTESVATLNRELNKQFNPAARVTVSAGGLDVDGGYDFGIRVQTRPGAPEDVLEQVRQSAETLMPGSTFQIGKLRVFAQS